MSVPFIVTARLLNNDGNTDTFPTLFRIHFKVIRNDKKYAVFTIVGKNASADQENDVAESVRG